MNETTRTRLSPDARRQQILDAAGRLYRERRYDDVSIEELAAAAGVARGLLHHYFGSKRELFLAVMTRVGAAARSTSCPTSTVARSRSAPG